MTTDIETGGESSSVPSSISTDSAADEAEADDDSVPTLDKDTVFGLLKNRRRREVLRYLLNNPETATMSDVAEHVAAKENGISEQQLSSKQRKRVYVALYQCHLPMMDEAGVIDFNRPRGRIEIRPAADQLQSYLIDATVDARSWQPYVAVNLFGGLLYVFASLLIGPGSWFATLAVIGLVSANVILSLILARETIATFATDLVPRLTAYSEDDNATNKTDSNPADD